MSTQKCVFDPGSLKVVSTTPLQQAKAVLGQSGAERGLRAGAFLKFGQYIVPDTTVLVEVRYVNLVNQI